MNMSEVSRRGKFVYYPCVHLEIPNFGCVEICCVAAHPP